MRDGHEQRRCLLIFRIYRLSKWQSNQSAKYILNNSMSSLTYPGVSQIVSWTFCFSRQQCTFSNGTRSYFRHALRCPFRFPSQCSACHTQTYLNLGWRVKLWLVWYNSPFLTWFLATRIRWAEKKTSLFIKENFKIFKVQTEESHLVIPVDYLLQIISQKKRSPI